MVVDHFLMLDLDLLLQKSKNQNWTLCLKSKRRIWQVHLVTSLLPSLLAAAPDFSRNPVKKLSVVQVGGEVTIACKPSASPRAVVSWRKGSEVLPQNKRYGVTEFSLF